MKRWSIMLHPLVWTMNPILLENLSLEQMDNSPTICNWILHYSQVKGTIHGPSFAFITTSDINTTIQEPFPEVVDAFPPPVGRPKFA